MWRPLFYLIQLTQSVRWGLFGEFLLWLALCCLTFHSSIQLQHTRWVIPKEKRAQQRRSQRKCHLSWVNRVSMLTIVEMLSSKNWFWRTLPSVSGQRWETLDSTAWKAIKALRMSKLTFVSHILQIAFLTKSSEINHYFQHGFAVTARNLLQAVHQRQKKNEKSDTNNKRRLDEGSDKEKISKTTRRNPTCQCCHHKGYKAIRGHRLENGEFTCSPCTDPNCSYEKGHKDKLLNWQRQLEVFILRSWSLLP